MITPMKGQEDNAISFGDMDGDGIDEAVVVYEYSKNKGYTIKAMLLRQENEAWQKISEVEGFGYGLDYAGFFDVDEDTITSLHWAGHWVRQVMVWIFIR